MSQIRQIQSIRLEEIAFNAPSGNEILAYVMKPAKEGKYPTVLYLHWYESYSPVTNRTQHLNEGAAWAENGVMSLHISTPWSYAPWFFKRDKEADFDFSQKQAEDFRAALDVLLSLEEVDKERVAVVGHDFGAMYGAVAFAEDKRLKAFVYIAGTANFPDWFMFSRRDYTKEQEVAFRQKFAPLDPVTHIGKFAPTPVLLQFGTGDFYTQDEKVEALWNAAGEPKQKSSFEGGHGLNEDARTERVMWLADKLGVTIPETWFVPPPKR
jgi:dipeptidyl aminopeptidase/acylaminoacyl peptidase